MSSDGHSDLWQQVQQAVQQFNGHAFLSTLIGKKIERYIGTLFDGIGEQTLRAMIAEGANLTDYIADKDRMRLKMLAMPYVKIVAGLEPVIMYSWLPDKYRVLFESTPRGRGWAMTQLQIIKGFLTS